MRQYVIQSWSDADTYDYSGEQVGDRKAKAHMLNPNKANLSAYGDVTPTKKLTKRSIRSRVSLADSNYDRLESLSLELDADFKSSVISREDYQELRLIMNARLDKAWQRLVKSRPSLATSESTQSPVKFSKNEISYTPSISPRLPIFLAEIGVQNRIVDFVNSACLTIDSVESMIKTVKQLFNKHIG